HRIPGAGSIRPVREVPLRRIESRRQFSAGPGRLAGMGAWSPRSLRADRPCHGAAKTGRHSLERKPVPRHPGHQYRPDHIRGHHQAFHHAVSALLPAARPVLMAFLSLLPAVGAALVWVPVAVYLLVTGAVWEGLVLIAYGALVISLVDNLVRPILVGADTKMPDYVVLISTLGGLEVLGMNGIVLGPVIAAMVIVVWDILAAANRRKPTSVDKAR